MIVKFITSDTSCFFLLNALNHNLLRQKPRSPRKRQLQLRLHFTFTNFGHILRTFFSLFTFKYNKRANALVFLFRGG